MTGEVRLITGRGTAVRVSALLGTGRVLVVASPGTVARTGLTRWLPPEAKIYTGFRPNPTVAQAVSAAAARAAHGADLVLGVGGGSALDVAKAARVLPGDPARADELIDGRARVPVDRAGLVLVPTTAGTGSEVTRFATLYRGTRKVSLDAAAVAADWAVVDPALTDSCPPELTWSCAFDALAHAVESMWSVRSTTLSRHYAESALRHLVPVIAGADDVPSEKDRDRLSEASTFAGLAIDITRTTAAHALAYPLTAHLGVPHGLACALNLTWLAPMVQHAPPDRVVDPRGTDVVRQAVDVLCAVLGPELGDAVRTLLARRGFPVGCAAGPAVVDRLLAEGLSSDRMTGTPVRLDQDRLRESITTLVGGSRA